MLSLTLAQIAAANGVPVDPGAAGITVRGVSIDSRAITPGSLFVAIRGERFDGHAYVAQALAQGAAAALVSTPTTDTRSLLVPDTIFGLQKSAKAWRDQFSLPILALTGSNGKTTVKEMLRTILEAHVRADAPRVLATAGNFNNHIGVPLMLARLNADHAYAVLETGMNHFGEIRTLTHLIKPHVALINNAGPAHLEGVGDLDGVARAKGELLEGLAADGSAVLNADDVYFAFWREKLAQGQTLISFGTSANADVRGQWADVAVGAPIEVTIHSDMATLRLPLAGAHNRMNALAAIAGAHALGVPLTTAVTALSGFSSVAGRQRVLAGLAGATIIDDSYNANPASVRAAIDSLVTRSGRRFLALGPLAELGAESDALHRILGESIARSAVDDFYAVGEPMRGAVEACNRIAPKARWFLNKAALVKALRPHLATTVTVLVKGSRSSAMEEVVTQIIEKKNSEVETPACS